MYAVHPLVPYKGIHFGQSSLQRAMTDAYIESLPPPTEGKCGERAHGADDSPASAEPTTPTRTEPAVDSGEEPPHAG